MSDERVDTRSARFVKAMTEAKRWGLTREDRLDLAEYLLHADLDSWTKLTEPQLQRILDAFTGFELIGELVLSRSRDQSGLASTAASHSR